MTDLGRTEKPGHPGGYSPDLLKDLVRGCCPSEWPGGSIPGGGKPLDRVLKNPNRRKGSSPDKLPSDYAIQDLDLIHPRSSCRREMKDHPAILCPQPLTG